MMMHLILVSLPCLDFDRASQACEQDMPIDIYHAGDHHNVIDVACVSQARAGDAIRQDNNIEDACASRAYAERVTPHDDDIEVVCVRQDHAEYTMPQYEIVEDACVS
jgi:hypothetical protein